MVFWIIDRDHLFEGDDSAFNDFRIDTRAGRTEGNRPLDEKLTKFRLYDDDGILYYEGRATDDGLEYVFDWGQRDAGITLLTTWNPADQVWEDCIA